MLRKNQIKWRNIFSLFYFTAVCRQKLCKKMGGTYANYLHFNMHDVMPHVEIMLSGDATWLVAIIPPHEYYANDATRRCKNHYP